MIEKELWKKFATMIVKKYYNPELKVTAVPHDDFDREVTEFTGGFSSYRIREWKKAGSLYGFLYRLDDLRYAVVLPQEKKEKK